MTSLNKTRNGEKEMQNIEIFNNGEFGEIRATTINEIPYFVGKDVAKALGYKDTSDALKRHVDEEDKLTRCFTDSGQSREMYIINESGLYSLVLSSKLPSAKKFKRWVTKEVLPSIRKHGAYATPATLENMLANPQFAIDLFTALKDEQDKNKQLELENKCQKEQLEIAEPKCEYYEEMMNRKDLKLGAREVGNFLRLRVNDVNKLAMKFGMIYSPKRGKYLPTREYQELFIVEEGITHNTDYAYSTLKYTTAARDCLYQKLKPFGIDYKNTIEENHRIVEIILSN